MAIITNEQVSTAFSAGMDWLADKLTRQEAIELLAGQHAINPVSAGDLLQVLKAMLDGQRFTRSISAPAADIYLAGILEAAGPTALAKAVSALDQHLAYYESIRPVTLHKLRAVRDKWLAALPDAPPLGLDDLSAAFEQEVAALIVAPAAKRRALLPQPGTKPKVSVAQVKVYQRSAAVVAEVLLRAAGNCESCRNPAPFRRASDGSPYLEVHHVVQLAHGGADTPDNAIAVCPNCHRRHHHGG